LTPHAHPCYTYVMYPHFLAQPPIPAPGHRPGSAPAPYFVPLRHFATLAAVQKKNSRCEPNFENAQPYDPKGVLSEIGGNSEHQVAQADAILRPATGRALASPEPTRRFATLVAVQKKNSPCEPNFENVQPYDLKGAQHGIAENSEHQVAQADRNPKDDTHAARPPPRSLGAAAKGLPRSVGAPPRAAGRPLPPTRPWSSIGASPIAPRTARLAVGRNQHRPAGGRAQSAPPALWSRGR